MSGGKGSNNLSIGKLGCSKIAPRLFQDCSEIVLSITQREDSKKTLPKLILSFGKAMLFIFVLQESTTTFRIEG